MRRLALLRYATDDGLSIIELSITLVVLAVVAALTFTLLVGLQQQQQNQTATVNGARDAQFAVQEVVQYLQAAASPVPGTNVPSGTQESATSLVLPAVLGNSPNAAPGATTTVTAAIKVCTNQCPKGVDELTVTFQGNSGTKKSVGIAAYYLLAPRTPVFTYEMYPSTGGPALQAMTMPVTQTACLERIVAVKLNASFLAGPLNPRTVDGGAAVPTTVNETVYVKNSDLVYGANAPVPPLPQGGC